MPCPAITISKPTCMNISTARGWRMSRRRCCSRLQPCDRPAHRQSPVPGERLCDDSAARQSRLPHHARRQSYLSGDGRHRLSEERRHARKSGADGEPCLDTHDAALRPPRRGSDARRGGAGANLMEITSGMRLRSWSVKPDDQSHQILVKHFEVAALADEHRNTEHLVSIGHVAPTDESIAFRVLERMYARRRLGRLSFASDRSQGDRASCPRARVSLHGASATRYARRHEGRAGARDCLDLQCVSQHDFEADDMKKIGDTCRWRL
jgi:hypothetical protein